MEKHPFFDRIQDSSAYVYFLRDYWDGGGSDVVAWWIQKNGEPHHLVAVTGETDDSNAKHQIIFDGEFDREKFDSLVAEVGPHIFDLRESGNSKVFSNSDDVVIVKNFLGRSNFFRTKTGNSANMGFVTVLGILAKFGTLYWNPTD